MKKRTLLLTIGFFMVYLLGISQINLSEGLVTYYPFSGNADDASVIANHGLVYNATLTTDRFGNPNSAYYFNGTNAYIAASANPLPDTIRTISLWFNAETLDNIGRYVLGYGGNGCGSSFIQQLNVCGTWGSYNVQGHCNAFNTQYMYPEKPVGTWYHWVVVCTATSINMYVNGVLVANPATQVSKTYTKDRMLCIGAGVFHNGMGPYSDGCVSFFKGSIDDIRIYKRVLTDAEISLLYHDEMVWNGSASMDWNSASNWTSTLIPSQHNTPTSTNSIKIPNTATKPVITSNNNIQCYNLTVESGGKLTLDHNATLTVDGTTNLSGNNALNLKAASNGSSGSLLYNAVTGTGKATVERYLTGNWVGGDPLPTTIYHSISSPVSGGTASTFSNCLLQAYQEATQSWQLITEPTTTLTNGLGYFVAAPSNSIRAFNGTLVNGDVTISGLSNTPGGNPAYEGYHIVGNPYPSALQYANFWTRTNILSTIYIWDPTTGNYLYHNGTAGTIPDGIIPMGQSFFMKMSGSGIGSMIIPKTSCIHSSNGFLKQETANTLTLHVQGNNSADATTIQLIPNASSTFDEDYDGYKLWGNQLAPQIYSSFPDIGELCIKALPGSALNAPIQIGFKPGVSGSFSLQISGIETFEPASTIYLEDKKEQKMIKVNDVSTYSFNSTISDDPERFYLHFNSVGIDPIAKSGDFILYTSNHTLFINSLEGGSSEVCVYDLLGRELHVGKMVGVGTHRIVTLSQKGYYIVKIVSGKTTTSEKVMIN